MTKLPKKYAKIILEAKNLGYTGAEAIVKTIPPKKLAKIYVATQDDKTLFHLFKEYDELGKVEKIHAFCDELKKKNRPIPDFIKEKYLKNSGQNF